eukprot:gene6889-biopygen1773
MKFQGIPPTPHTTLPIIDSGLCCFTVVAIGPVTVPLPRLVAAGVSRWGDPVLEGTPPERRRARDDGELNAAAQSSSSSSTSITIILWHV